LIFPFLARELALCGFMTYTHENMIIVAPPLIITEEQLAEEMAVLDGVLGMVDGMV
jgi:taurine--2-oxoglutarate transaminase